MAYATAQEGVNVVTFLVSTSMVERIQGVRTERNAQLQYRTATTSTYIDVNSSQKVIVDILMIFSMPIVINMSRYFISVTSVLPSESSCVAVMVMMVRMLPVLEDRRYAAMALDGRNMHVPVQTVAFIPLKLRC